jgi:hypothetical protein
MFFMYMSYIIDYFRGYKIQYDKKGNKEPPMTNLRHFANYYHLGGSIAFIVILYFLVKVVIRLIFK